MSKRLNKRQQREAEELELLKAEQDRVATEKATPEEEASEEEEEEEVVEGEAPVNAFAAVSYSWFHDYGHYWQIQLGGNETADLDDEEEEEEEEEVVAVQTKKVSPCFVSRDQHSFDRARRRTRKRRRRLPLSLGTMRTKMKRRSRTRSRRPRRAVKEGTSLMRWMKWTKLWRSLISSEPRFLAWGLCWFVRYGTSTAEQAKAATAGPSESKGFMAFRLV
jgi:hypothetical protein